MKPKYKESEQYKDFIFKRVVPIDEINCVLYELEHQPTKAQIVHIQADDPENVFCLSFRTYPENDNGVAHILEHTVLCGSEKFPVKDPFFSMHRRSLNTFMNAFTGSDFTCYPAASQVEKDFYNLLEVYLDAVFYPELKEMSFLQEGHRIEFEDPKDPTSPLTYRGIVFNEMKGSLNNPEMRLWHSMQKALFPNLLYRYNSGGEPAAIPNLTYEELKKFHATYYHPSQCLFYVYGNLDLKHYLDFIDNKVLKKTTKKPALPLIPKESRAKKRQKITDTFPSIEGDLTNKNMVAFGWLTTAITDTVETLALTLLDAILMENDASLIKAELQASKLTVSADAFMETDMSEVPYIIVCRGCNAENADALEKILFQSFKKIVKSGISQKSIDAAMHQLELSRVEITKDHGPYGLSLFMRSGLLMQHGGNPEDALKIHSLFDELKEHLKEEKYLEELIKKHFIDNHHYVRLLMKPDPSLEQKEEDVEKKALEKIKQKLSPVEKEKVIGTALALERFQDEQEEASIDCLPKLSIQDIPKKVSDFPLNFEMVNQLGLYHHETFTNGMTYADIIFDLYDTPMEDLHILKLFTSIITELGSGIRNYKETLEFVQSFTGGIYASLSFNPIYNKPTILRPTLSIHGKSLSRFNDHLFTILKDTILTPQLDDTNRIKELIEQTYTILYDKINRNALNYAVKSALAPFSEHNFIINEVSGLPYYLFIRDLALNMETKLEPVLIKLKAVKEKLFHLNNPHLVMTSDRETLDHIKKKDVYKMTQIPSSPFSPWVGNFQIPSQPNIGKLISSPVAFICQAYSTLYYDHPLSAALYLATFIMENRVLHQKIREQGGAYGSGASYYPLTGNFYFYSYRDPNLNSTLKAFKDAIDTIAKGQFNDQDLLEAKLGLIQILDIPISIGSIATVTYFRERQGRVREVRQAYRDAILNATKQDVINAVKEALLSGEDKSQISVFSSKEFLQREKSFIPLDISDI
ncbi:MAG: insulinase family protein [Simkaniaceae bacterium]|nr:insulinase family protein [Simkaniaceae bacterium]MCF7852366.1 insulinase family protein [Simkaniaceae bacterium]